jgi:hypothetical protein
LAFTISSKGMEQDGEPLRLVVRDLVADAIKKQHSAASLARKLEAELGRHYSESTISSWGRGRIEPPAATFLAVAKVSGLSIDDYLHAKPPTWVKEIRAELRDIRRQLRRTEQTE